MPFDNEDHTDKVNYKDKRESRDNFMQRGKEVEDNSASQCMEAKSDSEDSSEDDHRVDNQEDQDDEKIKTSKHSERIRNSPQLFIYNQHGQQQNRTLTSCHSAKK